MQLADNFEWARCDRYDLARGAVRSVGNRVERYRLSHFPALFATFAKAPASGKGMLDFCNRFGLLEHRHEQASMISVAVDQLLEHHGAIRRAFRKFEASDASELIARCNAPWPPRSRVDALAGVRLHLVHGPGSELELALMPSTLIQAMWTQFALHALSPAQIFMCEHCKKPFRVGIGTGRRSTAKYCSKACKQAAYEARKEA